jgi:hypothetical protein
MAKRVRISQTPTVQTFTSMNPPSTIRPATKPKFPIQSGRSPKSALRRSVSPSSRPSPKTTPPATAIPLSKTKPTKNVPSAAKNLKAPIKQLFIGDSLNHNNVVIHDLLQKYNRKIKAITERIVKHLATNFYTQTGKVGDKRYKVRLNTYDEYKKFDREKAALKEEINEAIAKQKKVTKDDIYKHKMHKPLLFIYVEKMNIRTIKDKFLLKPSYVGHNMDKPQIGFFVLPEGTILEDGEAASLMSSIERDYLYGLYEIKLKLERYLYSHVQFEQAYEIHKSFQNSMENYKIPVGDTTLYNIVMNVITKEFKPKLDKETAPSILITSLDKIFGNVVDHVHENILFEDIKIQNGMLRGLTQGTTNIVAPVVNTTVINMKNSINTAITNMKTDVGNMLVTLPQLTQSFNALMGIITQFITHPDTSVVDKLHYLTEAEQLILEIRKRANTIIERAEITAILTDIISQKNTFMKASERIVQTNDEQEIIVNSDLISQIQNTKNKSVLMGILPKMIRNIPDSKEIGIDFKLDEALLGSIGNDFVQDMKYIMENIAQLDIFIKKIQRYSRTKSNIKIIKFKDAVLMILKNYILKKNLYMTRDFYFNIKNVKWNGKNHSVNDGDVMTIPSIYGGRYARSFGISISLTLVKEGQSETTIKIQRNCDENYAALYSGVMDIWDTVKTSVEEKLDEIDAAEAERRRTICTTLDDITEEEFMECFPDMKKSAPMDSLYTITFQDVYGIGRRTRSRMVGDSVQLPVSYPFKLST